MTEQLLSTVDNARTYTLQVAEAMPEDAYTYKPNGAGWNFGELLNHIAYGIAWWQNNYITGNKTDWNPPAAKTTKKEVVAGLIKNFEALYNILKGQALTEQAVYGVHATLDHITHHRGQAVLYLRTHGINPPEYMY